MKWLRNLLKGVSFTTALFVFQACYGPYMGAPSTPFVFHVTADDTGEELEGVSIRGKISSANLSGSTLTGSNGMAYFYVDDDAMMDNDVQFVIETKDLSYLPKDTTIRWSEEAGVIEIKLQKASNE